MTEVMNAPGARRTTHDRDNADPIAPRLRPFFTIYLVGWTVGAVAAATSHLLLSRTEAEGSHFSHSPGWQHEIGFFNLAIAAILVQVLRRGSDWDRRMLARTALLLAPMLGTNHVVALAQGGPGGSRIHWTAIGLNLLSGGFSAVLLVLDRRSRVSEDIVWAARPSRAPQRSRAARPRR